MRSDFMEKVKRRIMSGAIFSTVALGYDYAVEGYLRKYAGKYADPIGVGIALGLDATNIGKKMKEAEKAIEDMVDALSDYSILKTAKTHVVKMPLCYFKDANTVIAVNLNPSAVDATKLKVFIDGVEATISGVDGTTDEVTISLQDPVASGTHELTIVSDTGKACYNKWAKV